MNRGSRGKRVHLPAAEAGFNEAPIHESGKCGQERMTAPRARSFNEAPIHESGKFGEAWFDHCNQQRFNEAPIHESGKWFRERHA